LKIYHLTTLFQTRKLATSTWRTWVARRTSWMRSTTTKRRRMRKRRPMKRFAEATYI
jgi:hypothetical protein